MDQFIRTKKLIGEEAFERLRESSVLVFGTGGVGSYVCEAVARAGIGRITVVDGDVVDESNINRQLVALTSTIGKNKADVMAERMQDINPDAVISSVVEFYRSGSGGDFTGYDFVVDAIDDVDAKVDIIKNCKEQGVRIISAMGGANKVQNEDFHVADLSKTHTCPLARVMRRRLRAEGIEHLPVVFSGEKPHHVEGVLGTMSYVPAVAGLTIAGYVIRELAGIEE